MDDDDVIRFLMTLAGIVARLHLESRTNAPPTNAGPNFGKDMGREAWDEGFARWMGWRGPEEQEWEIRHVRETSKTGA